MPDKVLDDLFHDTLKDIYYAERQILKALPKMARGAQSDHLRQAFEKHRDQTETHVERLRQVFSTSSASPPAARLARPSTASSKRAKR